MAFVCAHVPLACGILASALALKFSTIFINRLVLLASPNSVLSSSCVIHCSIADFSLLPALGIDTTLLLSFVNFSVKKYVYNA